MHLRPFGGTEQTGLLAVPGAIDDRTFGAPARFMQQGYATRFLEHCRLAAERIGRTIDPAVVMVPPDHPLVGPFAARQHSDDVIDGLDIPIEGQLEMDAGPARADMIGDRESPAPICRRNRTVECPKERLGVVIADGKDGNLYQYCGVFTI